MEQPAPWNPTKIFLVLLIALFLFPPFHTRSIVYHTKRNPINIIVDRHTSFIVQPPGPKEGGFALIEERFERSIHFSSNGGLEYPWEIYWGRLFIEMGAVALVAVLFTGRRRKWFAIGAGVLLVSGAIPLLLEDSPRVVRNETRYEPPPVDKKLENVPSMDPELLGPWKRTSVKRDAGTKDLGGDRGKYVMTIRGDGLKTGKTENRGVEVPFDYLLKVDQTKSPKIYEIWTVGSSGIKIETGIYAIEQNKLRMCFQEGGQSPPDDFTIDPDSQKRRVLYEFERLGAPPEKKKP